MKFILWDRVCSKFTLSTQIRRVMRLIALFLTAAFIQVNAAGFSQTLSISGRNISLEKVFKTIEKQSGYFFLYKYDEIEKAKPININLKNVTLEQALKQTFNDIPFTYSIEDKTIVVSRLPIKRQRAAVYLDLKGKVIDETGKALPGATIRIKDGSQATITNSDGEFTLKGIGIEAILIVSYTGYLTNEVPINNRTQLTISLKEDLAKLSEVVVVGYGTQERRNLTGAVDQISSKDIESRPVSSIATSLQGLLPGLNIQSNSGDQGKNPDINIRGFNSLNGGGPLVLVDGIEGNIERVNPSDVESVTVLKDAASSAIYGARGAFGVILITTKKGKEGEMVVNYTNNIGTTTTTTRTDYITDPYVYGKTVDAALFGYNGTTYTGYNDADYEIIKKVASGEIAPYQELQTNGNYKFYGKTDWYNYLFRQWQPTQNHNISISGGNKKLQAYLSGRYYNSSSIQNIVEAPLTRYNLKTNINFNATDWLQISDNIQFNTSDQTEYGGAGTSFGGIWSTTTWYYQFPFLPKEINGLPFDFYGGAAHPALEDASNFIRNYSEQLINTFSVKVTPLKDLVVNFDYSNRINHISNSTRLNTYQRLTGPKILLQTAGVNRLTENRNRNYYNALNIFSTYAKDFSDHHFKIMAGFNQEHYDEDNVLAEQGGLLFNDLSNLNLGTELLRADGSASLWAVRGYFGRFNYNYKNKYLVEVNARYDGSSRFPKQSRWGLFPSVSAGWYLSREEFWKPIENVVSSMKIRASYGKLGNQNVGLYTFSEILGLGQGKWLVNGSKINYAGIPAPLPSAVSWESTKTIDVGADVAFFGNKFTASFDWYEKNTSGMYLPGQPLPAVFGASEPKENIASLRNRGFELSLGYTNKIDLGGSPLNFRATASVYNFRGVITKYPNPNGIMSSYWEGQELGKLYGYRIDGQFQSDEEALAYQNSFTNPSTSLGQVYKFELNTVQNNQWKGLRAGDIKYLDINGDGAINKGKNTLADHGDLEEIGNSMPQFPFGFTFGADWKGIDFSVAGTGVSRQDWYPTGDIFWGTYERPYLSFIRKDLIDNAWTTDRPGNTFPQIDRGYVSLGAQRSLGEVNDYYLTNVGYLRVRNLTIGYTIPSQLTQKLHINKLRFYFSGENLFTWRFGDLTRYIDPEQAGSGINYNNPSDAVKQARVEDYPMGKTYSFGLSLTL
ncbi:MAG: TonB-dependent receptor [Pedobacter sp.]|uniref:TonB-dependent receptor n=1 Tax=Pedobacter sp. TaxID=1411316 RepID=UPI003563BABB